MNNDTFWVISARSGSKSIKDKNIKFLGEFPLIAYRIKTALSISSKENIFFSTDSKKYLDLSQRYGLSTSLLRPYELATDNATSSDVVKHAMSIVNKKYKYVGLLEPTSPFVYSKYIINAIELLEKNKQADSIVATKEVRPNSFFVQNESSFLNEVGQRLSKKVNYSRQNFSSQITPSGGFYISKWDSFNKNKGFYSKNTLSYKLPVKCDLEIDDPIDWLFAEFLIKENKIDFNQLWK